MSYSTFAQGERGKRCNFYRKKCKSTEKDTLLHSKLFWQLKGIHKTTRFLLKHGVQLKTPKTHNGTAAVWSDICRKWTGLVRQHKEICISLWLPPIYRVASGEGFDQDKSIHSNWTWWLDHLCFENQARVTLQRDDPSSSIQTEPLSDTDRKICFGSWVSGNCTELIIL